MTRANPHLPGGLYAVCDDGVRADLSLVRKGELLLEGGAKVLQLRVKRTGAREALAVARRLSALCRSAGAVCLIDDRVDWAMMANAHGVHLGDDDLPPAEARALLGPERIVGVTVRGAEAARQAAGAGADYVGLGPVFATATKQVDAAVLGVETLAAAVRACPLPVVAISGISLANIDTVAAAGAHGAAVISDLLNAADIPARARALAEAFAAGRVLPR